jgi:hypothetical protein
MNRLLLALLILIPTASRGQFRIGCKAGINFADIVMTNYINPDVESDLSLKAGLHAGIFAASNLDERWSLAGELLYSNKGVKALDVVNLHYVNSVFLLQYQLKPKIIIEGGGELGYLIAARSEGQDVRNTWNNNLDIGLDVGVQYLFNDALAAGLRYSAGFSSVIDVQDSGSQPGESLKYQNRVLQISLYYILSP